MTSAARDTAAVPSRAATARGPLGLTDGLLFLMAVIWAVNYSVLKFGTQLVPPLAYNGVRIPLAAVLQFGVARVMRLPAVSRTDVRRLVVLGMLGNGVYQVLFIVGMARSRVATTVLLLASGPALAALLGRLRGTERLNRRAWTGIGLQLAGVASVVLGTAAGVRGTDSPLGGFLVLAAALSWAVFAVHVQPFTERVSGLHVGAYTMLGGAVVSLVVALPLMAATPWRSLPPSVYGALGYSTIGAMVIAYLFWYHGVRRLGPTRTSMYGNLQPVIAMLVAWASLREVPTSWQVLGAVCITSGLILARTAGHEPEAP
jgi:drug/metabolite transporter (DMT)-like permease